MPLNKVLEKKNDTAFFASTNGGSVTWLGVDFATSWGNSMSSKHIRRRDIIWLICIDIYNTIYRLRQYVYYLTLLISFVLTHVMFYGWSVVESDRRFKKYSDMSIANKSISLLRLSIGSIWLKVLVCLIRPTHPCPNSAQRKTSWCGVLLG